MILDNMRITLITYMAVLASLALFAGGARAAGAPEGQHVDRIVVEGLNSMDESELLYLLDITPGMDLTAAHLNRGIKRAFLSGVFDSLSVESDDNEPGLVRVLVDERDTVEEIRVRVKGRLAKGFVEELLPLAKHDVVDALILEAARERLVETLKYRGYPLVDVAIQSEPGETQDRIRVLVDVNAGEPVVINDLRVVGRPFLEVVRLLRLGPGDVFDRAVVEEDMENIRAQYRERGYLNPDVGPYVIMDGSLMIGVRPGKRLNITFSGNTQVSRKDLLEAMPFAESGEFSDALLDEAVARVLSLYGERGYPSTQAAPVVVEGDESIDLYFYVYEGRGIEVGEINFSGVSIPVGGLREVMVLKEGDPFSQKTLDEDMARIGQLYYALGYRDVAVAPPHVTKAGGRVVVDVSVVEGPQVRIKSIGVTGNHVATTEGVLGAITVAEGMPYNEVDLADSRRAAQAYCRSLGLMNCTVEVSRTIGEGGVRVEFSLDEGGVFFFGKTVVTGNWLSRRRLIDRYLSHAEGEPVSSAVLMESRQRLYRLGLFSNVEVLTLDPHEDVADVQILVTEGYPGTVELGLGYGEYEGMRGYFEVAYRNLWGMARETSFRTEQSMLWSRYFLNYHEPWFFGHAISSRTFLLREEVDKKNIDTGEVTYRMERNAFSTGLHRELTPAVSAMLYYEYAVTSTYDVQPGVVLSKEDVGTMAISSVTPAIQYDTRDNPIDPSSGTLTKLSVKVATKALASETDFVKTTASLRWYARPFSRLVTAFSVRGGAAKGYEDTTELPIVERFFLGGRNTVRGFEQDMLGPLSASGYPIGGNAFLNANLELRVRLGSSWRVVPFLDAGNVWGSPTATDLGALRYTGGLGLQYTTPVGPVRLDYGYKLDREPGESQAELHFSIGHAF